MAELNRRIGESDPEFATDDEVHAFFRKSSQAG